MWRKSATDFLASGNKKCSESDFEGAITDYSQAIRLKPDFAEAYNSRGKVKAFLGDIQGALADYNQAIRLKPDYAQAYYNRGNAKDDLGDKQGAIADYNQAISLKPDYAQAYFNRGIVKFALGDREGALADYNQAIRLKPDYAQAYFNQGEAYPRCQDDAEAYINQGEAYPRWQYVRSLICGPKDYGVWVYGAQITKSGVLAMVVGRRLLLWDLVTDPSFDLKLSANLQKHDGVIFSLSLSSDNRMLATGSEDKTVCLWDIETRSLIHTFQERKDPIYSVAFSPDCKILAAGGENKYKTKDGQKVSIYLWSTETKKLIATFCGHGSRVNTLAFSPDNTILVSGGRSGGIIFWDVSSGHQLHHIYPAHEGSVGTVAFTPDGQRLVSSGKGGIKIWDRQSGQLQQQIAKDKDYVRCFAIHPSGKILVYDDHSGINIWNLDEGRQIEYIDFKYPISISFSADGNFLIAGDTFSSVKIFRER